MPLLNWLRSLVAKKSKKARKDERRPRSRWNRFIPHLEHLENRLAPATVSDGGTATLTVVLGNNENLAIVSNGSTYTFSSDQKLTNGGVASNGDFSGFDSRSLTLKASAIARYTTAISIMDSGAGDTVTFNDSGDTHSYANNFTVTLNSGSNGITFDGQSHFGANNISATTDQDIVLNNDAVLDATSGNITLQANMAGTATGNFIGINVDGATIQTTTGSIALTGTGGNNGNGNDGVEVQNGGTVQAASGTISLTGSGGSGNNSRGVDLTDSNTLVTAVDGSIDIAGSTSGSGGGSVGVDVASNAAVSTTRSGNISVTADGITIGSGTINAGTSTVAVAPQTTTNNVNLGTGNASGALGLTNGELNQITAGVLRIGGGSFTGAITITGGISPAHIGALSLQTTGGGTISENANVAITVAGGSGGLAVQANTTVSLTQQNNVGKLAAAIAGSGNSFSFTDSNGYAVSTVDGVAGISTPIGGGETVTLNAGGAVTEAAASAITTQQLVLLGTGSFNLSLANDVATLAADVTGSVSFQGAHSANLTIGTVGTVSGVTTTAAGADINISTNLPADMNVAAAVTAGNAAIRLTTQGGGSRLSEHAAITAMGANASVTLTADRINLAVFGGTVNVGSGANNIVTLQPTSQGQSIQLGATDINTSGDISQADLNQITAGVVRVGDLVNTGNLSVTSAIAAPAGNPGPWNTLSLLSGGTIGQTSGSTIAVAKLALQSAGAIALNEANAVGTVAANVSGVGAGLSFNNAGDLGVGTVDSVAGITTAGPISVTTGSGDITVAEDVSTSNAAVRFAAGTTAGGHTFTNQATISDSGSTTITIRADSLALQAGSAITASTSTGTVNLRADTGGISLLLGSTATGFALSQAELNTISAGTLVLTSFADIDLDGPVTLKASKVPTLHLDAAFGAIVDSNTVEPDVLVKSLAIDAGTGISIDTAVSNVAFTNTSGAVSIRNIGGLTIGSVDNITASSNLGTTTTLSASGAMTFAVSTTSAGTLIATTTEDGHEAGNPFPQPDDDLIVDIGASVESTAGDVDLTSGDGINLMPGSTVTSDSGAVSVVAGNGDVDGDASLTLAGVINTAAGFSVTSSGDIPVGAINAPGQTVTLTSTGGAILDVGDGIDGTDISAATVNLNAATGIGIAGHNVVQPSDAAIEIQASTLSFSNSTSGDVNIINVSGDLSASGSNSAIGGQVNLTVGSGNNLTVNASNISSTNGNISLAADTMTLTGTVNAGAAVVTFAPFTSGHSIDLGTNSSKGSLGLAAADIDNVTAGILRIGSSSAGSITIDAAIIAPTATPGTWSTLSLLTGGGISETFQGDLVVTNLAVQATGGCDLGDTGNSVTTLAASGGSLLFQNNQSLIVGTVDGINGISATNGLFLSSNLAGALLTVGQTVSNSGHGETVFAFDNMTLNATVTDSNRVVLTSNSPDQPIDLGGPDAFGTLGLASAELNEVSAPVLQVGDTLSGNITISTAIAPTHVTTLTLETIGAVSEPAAGDTITVPNLAIDSIGAVTLTQGNDVTTGALAADVAGVGQGFSFTDVNDLTIGTVDGVAGITANGAVAIVSIGGSIRDDGNPNTVVSGQGISLTAAKAIGGDTIIQRDDVLSQDSTFLQAIGFDLLGGLLSISQTGAGGNIQLRDESGAFSRNVFGGTIPTPIGTGNQLALIASGGAIAGTTGGDLDVTTALTLSAASDTNLLLGSTNGDNVNVTSAVTNNGATAPTTFVAADGTVSISAPVSSVGSVTLTSAGSGVSINNNVSATGAGSTITVDSTGDVSLAGTTTLSTTSADGGGITVTAAENLPGGFSARPAGAVTMAGGTRIDTSANNGTITVDAGTSAGNGGDITLTAVDANTGAVNVQSFNGSILDGNGVANNITGGAIDLSAAGASGINLDVLTTTPATAGVTATSTGGNIALRSTQQLQVDNVNAGTSNDVRLIVNNANTATSSITSLHPNDGVADVTGRTVTLIANGPVNGTTGQIGFFTTSAQFFEVSATTLNATTNNSRLWISAIGGTAVGSVNAGTDSALLKTVNGDLTSTHISPTPDIIAGSANLMGSNGSLGSPTNPLLTQTSSLSASATGSGSVDVTNVPAGGNLSITSAQTANGHITISATGAVNVNGNVESSGAGDITLTATDLPTSGQDLNVAANETISSNGGNIVLQAGDNIIIDPTATVSTSGMGSITLTGDFGNADASGGTTITFSGASLSASSATVNGGTFNDVVNINGASSTPITISGGGNSASPTNTASFTVGNTAVSQSQPIGDTVNFNDSSAAAGSSYSLNGSTVQRTGTGQVTLNGIQTLNLTTSVGSDTVEVATTMAGTTSVNGSGNDTFDVTTTADNSILNLRATTGTTTTVATTGAGSILSVLGGTGANSFTLKGTGAKSGVQFNGGAGSDTVAVLTTSTGSATAITDGAGNDSSIVGDDNNSLSGIQGVISINGGGHSAAPTNTQSVTAGPTMVSQTLAVGDAVTFNDQNGLAGSTESISGTAFSRTGTAQVLLTNIETETINLSGGTNTVNVAGTIAGTTAVNGSSGNNFNVTTTAANSILDLNDGGAPGNSNTIISGSGSGSIVDVVGNSGTNTFTLNGNGTGSGVQFDGSAGSDIVAIHATATGSATAITDGAGNDTNTVGSVANSLSGILGNVSIDGGGQSAAATITQSVSVAASSILPATTISRTLATGDAVTFNDQGFMTGTTYSLSGTTVSRTGTGKVFLSHIETETLNTSHANDVVNVASTIAGTTTLNAAANNTVSVTTTAANSIVDINAAAGGSATTVNGTGSGSIVKVAGNSGTTTFTLGGSGMGSGVQFDGNAGSDTVTVRTTGTSSATRITDGRGADSNSVGNAANSLAGISGAISFDGGGGKAATTLNDQGDTAVHTYTITGTEVDRASAHIQPILYSRMATLTLNQSQGTDTTNILSTFAGITTNLNGGNGTNTTNVVTTAATSTTNIKGGAGVDTTNLGPTSNTLTNLHGAISDDGGGGANNLNLNDQNDPSTTGQNLTITANKLTNVGSAAIAYAHIQSLIDNATRRNNTYTLNSVSSTTTKINAEFANANTLDLNPDSGTVVSQHELGFSFGVPGFLLDATNMRNKPTVNFNPLVLGVTFGINLHPTLGHNQTLAISLGLVGNPSITTGTVLSDTAVLAQPLSPAGVGVNGNPPPVFQKVTNPFSDQVFLNNYLQKLIAFIEPNHTAAATAADLPGLRALFNAKGAFAVVVQLENSVEGMTATVERYLNLLGVPVSAGLVNVGVSLLEEGFTEEAMLGRLFGNAAFFRSQAFRAEAISAFYAQAFKSQLDPITHIFVPDAEELTLDGAYINGALSLRTIRQTFEASTLFADGA
jgi:hypothetical protein